MVNVNLQDYQLSCSLYGMLVIPLLCQFTGFLWYGPLLGRVWAREMGFKEMPKNPPMMPYALTLAANFLTSFMMINIHAMLGVASIQQALSVGFLFWAATIALRMPHYAFAGKSVALFLIDGGFDLALAGLASTAVLMLKRM